MQKPIRILHVLGGLSLGGAESRIMDLYRNLDRDEIQFDFLVHSKNEEHFDKEIEKLGGNVYRIPRFKVYNWFGYKKALKQFFSVNHGFRAVHGHMTSTAAIYLPIAKKAGIPITIAHARSAGVPAGIKGLITKCIRYSLKYKADYCLACSKEAGEAVYGSKWMDKGRVEVIPNAIDAGKYSYNEAERNKLRTKLGIENNLVIGHVGSFRAPKNHEFLIRIFAEINAVRKDAVLLLLGEGEGMDAVKKQVENLGLTHAVRFLGNQANVSPYYQAMDFLVFPSLFEGLPGTIIEAQTSGLRCLLSDRITKEVKITGSAEFYSLDKTVKEWASYIIKHCNYERENCLDAVKKAGFDIKEQIKKYKEIYQKNILLIVPLLHQGGFERICALTAHLLKDKYNVSIAVFSTKNMFYDVSGVTLLDLNLASRKGTIGKVWNVLLRRSRMKKIKKDKKIHISYSFGLTANLVNALSRVGDKIWIGIRGYGALEDKHNMALTCKRADRVICCAKVMVDDVEKLYHTDKVTCLYNPCDIKKIRRLGTEEIEERHREFIEGEGHIIASMSREDDVKGFWHLIKAFSLIQKEMPSTKLMIIGDGDFSEYEKLADDLKLKERILFTGLRKNPFSYLSKADLYIMTSYTEGFPNSLIEAMAVGLPAMATNCKTGPAEIMLEDYKKAENQHEVYEGEYGVLLPLMSPNKNLDASVIEEEEYILAREAVSMLQDSDKMAKMKDASARRSEFYSIDQYVDQLVEELQMN